MVLLLRIRIKVSIARSRAKRGLYITVTGRNESEYISKVVCEARKRVFDGRGVHHVVTMLVFSGFRVQVSRFRPFSGFRVQVSRFRPKTKAFGRNLET